MTGHFLVNKGKGRVEFKYWEVATCQHRLVPIVINYLGMLTISRSYTDNSLTCQTTMKLTK